MLVLSLCRVVLRFIWNLSMHPNVVIVGSNAVHNVVVVPHQCLYERNHGTWAHERFQKQRLTMCSSKLRCNSIYYYYNVFSYYSPLCCCRSMLYFPTFDIDYYLQYLFLVQVRKRLIMYINIVSTLVLYQIVMNVCFVCSSLPFESESPKNNSLIQWTIILIDHYFWVRHVTA